MSLRVSTIVAERSGVCKEATNGAGDGTVNSVLFPLDKANQCRATA